MNFVEYKKLVSSVTIGKSLPDAIYVHKDAFTYLPLPLLALLHKTYETLLENAEFNIVKIFKKEFKASYLNYPDFDTLAHPVLTRSISINLESLEIKNMDYSQSDNPPILHRKESFIPTSHPLYNKFKETTELEESFDLYTNTNKIGFKKYWDKLCQKKNLYFDGNELKVIIEKTKDTIENENPLVNNDTLIIERHKTAISRNNLSRPLQSILGFDLLTKDTSYFDYGCGLGDDVKELVAHEYQATGWDPAHNTVTQKQFADIVNLGFVINVIENIQERVFVLKDAFQLAKKVLVVSALTKNGVDENKGSSFKDGLVTSRNTFQKYYEQEELKAFIENTLNESAIPVSMGIFFVYKSEADFSEHLNKQYRTKVDWQLLTKNSKPIEKITKKKLEEFEKHAEILNEYWAFSLNLGRWPKNNEFDRDADIKNQIGSSPKIKNLLLSKYGEDLLNESAKKRTEDILLLSALLHFKKKIVFNHLGKTLQNDILEFYGKVAILEEQSKKLLFQLGDSNMIEKLCKEHKDLGYLDEQALYILYEQLPKLPLILRLYVLCATQFYGEINKIDIIKIHQKSGKVTLLQYDNLEESELPELKLRVKVALRGQKIDVFNYDNWPEKQLLYYKSKYLPKDDQRFATWSKINKTLLSLNIPTDAYGPSKAQYLELRSEQ